jgi:hypothetical protein
MEAIINIKFRVHTKLDRSQNYFIYQQWQNIDHETMGAWEVEVESVGSCDAYCGNRLLECWGL